MVSNGRILIVDDNTKNIEVLANILSSYNYEIEIGINGLEVFNWLQNDTFDLILLDVMMPDINGFDVCRKVREDPRYDLMPVIFISAKSDTQSMVEGFEAGGQDYITKPFDKAELMARIKTHIELKKSKEKLKVLNNSLEQKIEERTKELNKAYQQLTDLSMTKDRFLSFIGQEVSSPLVAINKVVDVIKHVSESSRMAEMIALLDQSVNKLDKVSQMATYITQLNATDASGVAKRFSLLSGIDFVLTDMNEQLDKKDLELDIDIDEKSKVMGNNKLFRSSFQAILSAIIQSMEKGQLIKIFSIPEKKQIHLQVEAYIDNWLGDDNELSDETALYVSYSQTIMSLDGGYFSIASEDQKLYAFKWTFKNN